jgi:hypothetical protein
MGERNATGTRRHLSQTAGQPVNGDAIMLTSAIQKTNFRADASESKPSCFLPNASNSALSNRGPMLYRSPRAARGLRGALPEPSWYGATLK